MRETKWAWWLAVAYSLGALLFFVTELPSYGYGSYIWSLIVRLLAFHIGLLVLFF